MRAIWAAAPAVLYSQRWVVGRMVRPICLQARRCASVRTNPSNHYSSVLAQTMKQPHRIVQPGPDERPLGIAGQNFIKNGFCARREPNFMQRARIPFVERLKLENPFSLGLAKLLLGSPLGIRLPLRLHRAIAPQRRLSHPVRPRPCARLGCVRKRRARASSTGDRGFMAIRSSGGAHLLSPEQDSRRDSVSPCDCRGGVRPLRRPQANHSARTRKEYCRCSWKKHPEGRMP